MKIFVYSYRRDEAEFFAKFSDKYNVEIAICKEAPSIENYKLAEGCNTISIITTEIPGELVEKFYSIGVRFISTRTIGFEHIDLKKSKELGIRIGNVTYSPSSVADYAVMMILMAIRKINIILERSKCQDYSLSEIRGKELHNLTVGVIGTGKIGQTVIKRLSGFDCDILAYDLYQDEKTKNYAKYVPLKQLLENSDIITLHIPGGENTHHMINKTTISKMKDNVIIINTARGSLIDTNDLIEALEEKKVLGAALDVIENESDIYYKDLKGEVINNKELAVLRTFPNVIVTPHTAFYTDQAVSDMVENSIQSCILFAQNKENPWEVKF